MRLAIIGCGAVAAVHAAGLRGGGFRIAAVYDSVTEKAESFASAYCVERVAQDLASALDGADAVIVASPSALHYEHALCALERGLHVLVELPPCASAEQSEHLAQVAAQSDTVLQCAHTSRYLEPYRRAGDWIRETQLGEIRQVQYFRCVLPARRSWIDDALLHHAAHPLDLLLHWFGDLQPVGCAAFPRSAPHQDVSLLARLPNGAPASIAISYSAKSAYSRLSVIGDKHTVVTDGFSFIDSGNSAMTWRGDAAETYEQSVAEQDLAFLRCCETGDGGIPWMETTRMMRQLEAFQGLR
jgi:2-hydroxy-4-carboxymuconate semialdehyde hemiacetal dehydrogenase